MIRYCNDVACIMHRIGSIENLNMDITCQYALAGAVQQIGECTRRIDIWLENHSDYSFVTSEKRNNLEVTKLKNNYVKIGIKY